MDDTVLNLASNEEDEVTCVGVFQMISEGESLELTGEYTVHPSYGPQFKVQQYSIKAPEDIASIERYLGSGAIKGVGAALAARIVRKFKEDTFRIIEEEPERLAEIKGTCDRNTGDRTADRKKARITSGNDLFTELRDIIVTGGKNIPDISVGYVSDHSGKSLSDGGGCDWRWF